MIDGAPWGGREPAFAAVLLAAGPDGGGVMAQAIELAGGAVLTSASWDAPMSFADDALLVLDTAGVPTAQLDGAFRELAARADVVSCTLDQLDQVADAMLWTDAQFLCAPTVADRVAALAVAAGLAAAETAPGVREGEAARLRRLQSEVARVAAVLARLATDERTELADRRPQYDAGPAATIGAVDPLRVRQAIRARRLRAGIFGDDLFEDPAWDMLLDLFAAELEGTPVSVSSLCIAAAVAPTTALRWIGRLTDAGLFERRPDPQDRRRAFIALTARGSGAMRSYVAVLERAGLVLG